MNALDQEFHAAVERECKVIAFTGDDHDAKADSLDDAASRSVKQLRRLERQTKDDLRTALYAIDDQITELQRKREETEAGGQAKLDGIRRQIRKAKAVLAAE